MNYNFSSSDSKYHSEITGDIAQFLQSDRSGSLKRESASNYLGRWERRERMQSARDKKDGKLINNETCTSLISVQSGNSHDTDSSAYCNRVPKSPLFNECLSNNVDITEHTLTSDSPATMSTTLTENMCCFDETSQDSIPGSSRRSNNIRAQNKGNSTSCSLGENEIDDLQNKFSVQGRNVQIRSSTPPENLSMKDPCHHDKKILIERINEMETEKLDAEKKLLDIKWTILSLQKENTSLNGQYSALHEIFLAQQLTDQDKTKRIAELEKQNWQAEKELEDLKASFIMSKREKDSLLKKIADLEDELAEQKLSNRKLVRDKEKDRDLVEEVESLREWIVETISDIEVTKNNMAKLSTLLKQNSLQLRSIRSLNKKLTTELGEATKNRHDLEKKNTDMENRLEHMKIEVEDKTARIEHTQLDLLRTKKMNLVLVKPNHSQQSSDMIETIEKDVNDMRMCMDALMEEHRDELEGLEK